MYKKISLVLNERIVATWDVIIKGDVMETDGGHMSDIISRYDKNPNG
jgi:hypothetical protein